MKRQLIAALLALNVAAVAVPSATFTVNAAEDTGIEAQAYDVTEEDRELSNHRTEKWNEVNAYVTKSYSGKAATKLTDILNDADKDLRDCKDKAVMDDIAETAKKAIDNLADDDYKNDKKSEIDAVQTKQENGVDVYFGDTQAKMSAIATGVKSDLDSKAVTKENADNYVGIYNDRLKEEKIKTAKELKAEYTEKVKTYLPENYKLEDYGTDQQKLIKNERNTQVTAIDNVTTATGEADVKAAYTAYETYVKNTVGEPATLTELKTSKIADLNKYWPEGQKEESYTDVQLEAIRKFRADGVAAITAAKTVDKVNAEYDTAIKNINGVITKDQSEAKAAEVKNLIKAIGKLDTSNYNDKYAAIKAANEAYNKLEEGSVGKAMIDKDNVVKDDPNYYTDPGYTSSINGHYTYLAVLNNAKKRYDDITVRKLTEAYRKLAVDFITITADNYQDYQAEIDSAMAAEKTLFDAKAIDELACNTAKTEALNAYNTAKTNIISAAATDFSNLSTKLAHVIDGDEKVTDENKADVDKAIKAYRILVKFAETDHDLLEANSVAYGFVRKDQDKLNKLVAALKVYQDAQQKAEDRVNLEKADVTLEYESTTYTGKELRPVVTVKNTEGVTLVENKDYTVTYNNNVNVGEVKVTVVAIGNEYKGSNDKATFKITQKSLADAKVTVENLYYRSGKARNASPAVKVDGVDIARNRDYTVAYKNNTNVGAATVEITGVGNYTGKTKATYAIMPEKAKITSLKAGSKKFTVKVVKEKGAKYQVAYKVKGTSKYKTVTTSNVTKTVKGLKKGKTYSVKVRAYQTINGKKYLGNYSNVKNVKVK